MIGDSDIAEQENEQDKKALEKYEAQKKVDAAIIASIEKTPLLKDYMRSTFTLRQGQFPHEMKF